MYQKIIITLFTLYFCFNNVKAEQVIKGEKVGDKTLQAASPIEVLPVSLLSFTSERSLEAITLKWSTISEANNSHFIIQASENGSVWKDLGEVASSAPHGNSNELINYTFNIPISDFVKLSMALLVFLGLGFKRNLKLMLLMMMLIFLGAVACKDKNEVAKKIAYFRIVQVDLDGKRHVSPIIVAGD
jgi:hypothetical protein